MSVAPVLFLIFNRPDTTALVMQAIRAARPPRLYVAADGPRERIGEAERCEEARRVAAAIDWDCKVQTLYRKHNLGCREAVSSAINWFFENESEGIILEDDCLPEPSFFPFCGELLAHFRDDERIMCVTGNNFQREMGDYPYSYYFSKYNHCWGWASWRRAWQYYDCDMESYRAFNRSGLLEAMSSAPGFTAYWQNCFNSVEKRELDTWDYVWTYSCWAKNGLTVTPRCNLVSNIGFGQNATHTTDPESSLACRPVGTLSDVSCHPPLVILHQGFDGFVDRAILGVVERMGNKYREIPRNLLQRLKTELRRLSDPNFDDIR